MTGDGEGLKYSQPFIRHLRFVSAARDYLACGHDLGIMRLAHDPSNAFCGRGNHICVDRELIIAEV